jgi:5-formyltetrahydrofolate cyclo-ligase
VPWCTETVELALFHLENMEELTIGMYKILEPKPEVRSLPEKQIDPKELDLVMVPGVAFDRRCARMGHGKGYYDKLLENVRPGTPLVALAFECQFFPEIPMAPHDVFMDKIISEDAVYSKQ